MNQAQNPANERDGDSPAPERFLLTAKGEYSEAADKLLGMARRELRIFDPDLSEFRLETPARIEALRQFLARSRGNHLYIALHDTEYVKRYCPRLITLLGTFAGSMTIRRTEGEATKIQDCFVLADQAHVVRRPVTAQGRGVFLLNDTHEGLGMRDRFNEIWQLSESGVSANTTGL